MRNALSAIGLLLTLVATCPIRSGAQSTPSKEDVGAWLEKALDHATFSPVHGTPVHVTESIHYTVGTKSLDGVEEILSGPEGTRKQFKLGDMGQVELIVPAGKKYTLRNGVPAFYIGARLDEVNRAVLTTLTRNPVVDKVEMSKSGGICAELAAPPYGRQVCFDAATHAITSVTMHFHPFDGQGFHKTFSDEMDVDATDFAEFGGSRYAPHLVVEASNEKIEVTFDNVSEVQSFAPNVFAPPPTATEWDWCANVSGHEHSTTPQIDDAIAGQLSFNAANPSKTRFLFYVVVGTDGRVTQIEPILGGDSRENRIVEKVARDSEFSKKSCNGKPVQYELFYHFDAR
jgi:hypothetical protein